MTIIRQKTKISFISIYKMTRNDSIYTRVSYYLKTVIKFSQNRWSKPRGQSYVSIQDVTRPTLGQLCANNRELSQVIKSCSLLHVDLHVYVKMHSLLQTIYDTTVLQAHKKLYSKMLSNRAKNIEQFCSELTF